MAYETITLNELTNRAANVRKSGDCGIIDTPDTFFSVQYDNHTGKGWWNAYETIDQTEAEAEIAKWVKMGSTNAMRIVRVVKQAEPIEESVQVEEVSEVVEQSVEASSASTEVKQIVEFWLSQMWSGERLGRVTAENLYNVIQRYSDHPDKGRITVEDCAKAMRLHAQQGRPELTTEEQAEIEAQLQQRKRFLEEMDEIEREEWTPEEAKAFTHEMATNGIESAIEKVKPAKKRPRGRPRQDKATRAYTLDRDLAEYLDGLPDGDRSRFVNEVLRQHPSIAEALEEKHD